MKKIRGLQLLVYFILGLLLTQNFADEFLDGFKEGYYIVNNAQPVKPFDNQGVLWGVNLDGIIVNQKPGSFSKINNSYALKRTSIKTDVIYNTSYLKTPWWSKYWVVIAGMFIIRLFVLTAAHINNLILNIYNETIFNDKSIKLIRKVGTNMIWFCVADYILQWGDYIQQSLIIKAPLSIIFTANFNFTVLLCSIFVFIIAEAFKQGIKLKEEQELTI